MEPPWLIAFLQGTAASCSVCKILASDYTAHHAKQREAPLGSAPCRSVQQPGRRRGMGGGACSHSQEGARASRVDEEVQRGGGHATACMGREVAGRVYRL